jgi:acetoacetyl-CoA synthetase
MSAARTAPPILWTPSAARIERATLTRYLRWLRDGAGPDCDGYHQLRQWSIDQPEEFWQSIWDFFEVFAASPPEAVLDRGQMPGASWFPGARLNYAEHVLRTGADDAVAIIHTTEHRDLAHLTWGELRDQVARAARGLRGLGVKPGDRVVAYLPNVPEAVIGLLASAAVGAVWSSCSPDFGACAVLDRFAQLEPKILLTVDGYRYGGRDFDRREVLAELHANLPSLLYTVVLPHLDKTATIDGALTWSQLVDEPAQLRFESVAFDHPLWVLYSSGTTGLPKGIVHGHGGILLEHLKQTGLQIDAKPGDRIFWFTTTGWMMWNLLVGCLLTDATIVLYDGNPGHPDLGTLWDLAEQAGITTFGTSASYIETCMKADVRPGEGRDLSALEAVGSTGSPLAPEGFAWIYEQLGADTWLFSTSGGSDVCTAFVGGCPLLPVHQGELQCRALGVAIEALNERGEQVTDEVGELVITAPMPSMPIGRWDDPDGERYRDSYFAHFPGIWRHGDWIKITSRGTAVIYGRSDSTINRGGIRMGTSEIYRSVLALAEIDQALVVDADGWMPLFVVLAPDVDLDETLRTQIAQRIRQDCSPRHVPSEVFAVDEIPRTRTGKLLEVPVKRILLGTPVTDAVNPGSVANPRALDYFAAIACERDHSRSR